jgi:hypothetical protein
MSNLFNVFKEWYLETYPYQKIPSFQEFNLKVGDILGKQPDSMFWTGIRLKRFHIFGDVSPTTEENNSNHHGVVDCGHNENHTTHENKHNHPHYNSTTEKMHRSPHYRVNVRIDHVNPKKSCGTCRHGDAGSNNMNLPQPGHSFSSRHGEDGSESRHPSPPSTEAVYGNPFDLYPMETQNEERNNNVVNPFDEFEPEPQLLTQEQTQSHNPFDDILVENECIVPSNDRDHNYYNTTVRKFVDDDYYSTIIDIVSGISTQKRTGMNIWGDLKDMMSRAKTQKKNSSIPRCPISTELD